MLVKSVKKCFNDIIDEINTSDKKYYRELREKLDVLDKSERDFILHMAIDLLTHHYFENATKLTESEAKKFLKESIEHFIETSTNFEVYVYKMTYRDYPDRLYRTIEVPGYFTLDHLCVIALGTMKASTEGYHLYRVEADGNRFDCPFADDVEFMTTDEVAIEDLEDPDNISILYDFGECYEFDLELEEIRTGTYNNIITDGKGYGIAEDDKEVLNMYYSGQEYTDITGKREKVIDILDFDPEEFNLEMEDGFARYQMVEYLQEDEI